MQWAVFIQLSRVDRPAECRVYSVQPAAELIDFKSEAKRETFQNSNRKTVKKVYTDARAAALSKDNKVRLTKKEVPKCL